MGSIKRSIAMAIAIAVAVLGVTATQASAAGETVSSFEQIIPRGPLSKTERRPVDVRLEGKVSPGQGQSKLRELLNVKLHLPRDFTFSPSGTPACTKDIGQKNPNNANRPTAAIIAECPGSVVGDGTAVINVAGSVSAPVNDPQLVIFNAGKDNRGHAKLLIHGFSATVVPGGFGIIMIGSLVNGVLDVQVPKLAADSSVTEFKFDLPGTRGKDPGYTRAKCSSGKWKSNAVFTLGESDPNTGGYINKSALTTAPTIQQCVGKGGRGKFVNLKIKGKKKVKQGKRATFKVKVRNKGSATIKNLKIVARGKGAKGKRSGGRLAAGESKTIKVKVKFRKKGKVKVKFKANGKGVKAKVRKIKVKVR